MTIQNVVKIPAIILLLCSCVTTETKDNFRLMEADEPEGKGIISNDSGYIIVYESKDIKANLWDEYNFE